MTGTTPAAVADSLHRSRMLVSNVIHGRTVSRPVADKIAKLLKTRADKLWPGKYAEQPVASKGVKGKPVALKDAKSRPTAASRGR